MRNPRRNLEKNPEIIPWRKSEMTIKRIPEGFPGRISRDIPDKIVKLIFKGLPKIRPEVILKEIPDGNSRGCNEGILAGIPKA